MKALVVGFDRFGRWPCNPAELVVRSLAEGSAGVLGRLQRASGDPAADSTAFTLETRVLPTAYDAAGAAVEALLASVEPDAMLCLGLAGGRERISLERFALNVDDAALADNAGTLRRGEPIEEGGPEALRTGVDLSALLGALAARELDAEVSNHAGTFVCNHVYYRSLRTVERLGLATRCVFVHLPMLGTARARRAAPRAAETSPASADADAGWRVEDLRRGAETVLDALLVPRERLDPARGV